MRAARGLGFTLVFRQRREQRLRLCDLGHLRGRREAFERGAEDGVSFDGAAGRLVELGERERGAEFEASRLLRSRDCDGGEESGFGERGVRRIALQEDCAADAVEQRVSPVLAGLVR